MPQVIPAAMAAFAAIKGAVAAVTAVKVLGVTLATWGKVAMWASMGASMLMKPPGLPSSGTQVNLQPAGPDAPLPIPLGRTGIQGFITYREAYPDAVHNSDKNNKLCFETVVGVGPIKSISNYTLTGHRINWDREPTRLGSSTGVSICRSVTGFNSKSSVWKDGVRAAFILGEHNDTRTLRDITGDSRLPFVTSADKMSGLARIVQVFELDGSKNLRFPGGFPDGIQATVEGIFAWDARQDSTYPGGSGPQRLSDPTTWGWSENPYVLALAYLIGRKGPTGHKMWGIGADPDFIDIPAFMHGANVADLHGWKVGGMVTTDDSKDAVLSNILAAGAGQYLPGPKISVFVNEPKVSTYTIRQSQLIGDQTIRPTRTAKNRFNRILVKYREPNSNYEVVTGEAVSDAGYLAADGGILRTTETTYPLIQQATQAHQIAAYELVNSREYELDIKIMAEGLAIERGDMITLDFPLGAVEGQSFIVKDWSFDAAAQAVDLTLVSETAGKHDFALGRTATAPAPAGLKSMASLNPSAPAATDWTLVANQIVQPRPVVEPVEGEEPPVPLEPVLTPAFVFDGEATDPAISAIVVEVRSFDPNRPTRLPGETDAAYEARQDEGWAVAFEAAANSTRLIVSEVSPATTYDIAIRYRTNLNATSPRLVYGGRATGNLSFDWNDPNVIVNVPPALDVDQNGQLQPGHIASGVPGFASLEAFNAAQKLFNEQLQQDQADADEKLTDGLAAEAEARDALKTALEDADQTITEDLSGLKNEIVGARGSSTTLAGHLTTIQNDINGKVSATEIEALETEVTDARGSFGSINSRLNKAETDLNGKAEASRVSLLESRSRVTPNLVEDGSFNRPLGECWYLEGGAGPYLNYDAQVGSFLHSDSHYVVSKTYPFTTGYQASISWDGEAVNTGANVYLQALPSYALLARAFVDNGEGNGFGKRKVSDGSTVAAPAGTTGFRVVIDPAGGSMNVSRIKVNHGSVATAWSDELTTREATSRIAVVETANANGATRITELEAISDDEYLTLNTGFNLYTNGAQTGFTTPDKWYPWGEKVNDSHRVPGHLGKYAWWSHNNFGSGIGGGDVGISQDFNNNPRLAGLTTGYYVLEADIYFAAGEIGGAGVYWYFQNGNDGRINFATDKTVDGEVVGFQGASSRAYSWRKLVHIDNAGTGNTVFHLMTEWDGFEAGARPKLIEWQRCGLRKATAQEVAAERADTNASNAQSRLTIVESTTNEIVGRGGGGGNLVGNTSLESMTGWTPLNYFGDPSVLDTANLGINYPSDNNWHPSGDNCLSMFVKAPTTVYADWYSDEFPLTPGKTFEFGMSAAVHRTYAECYLEVRNADGSQATYPWALCDGNRLMYENYSGGRDLQAYGQFWGKYTVPTSGQWTRGRLILRRGPTASGQVDSWSWFTRPYCREIPVGQTKPSPWDYGAQRWLSRARWSVQPAVNGATSFITAEAVNNNGVASSNVSIGAQSIQMYNQNGQDWKLAMSVQGGNATFTGNLQASRILLGNGTGWDIQKAQKVFSATDGQVISFGTDLGAIPSISFERDGLAPLNAGETYDIRAVNLSATGFQLSAKINIPAAQSSQQTAGPGYSEVVNSTGNNGRTLYLEGKPTSVDGVYRFQAIGYQEHRFPGRYTGQAQLPDGESLDYVGTTLGIWAYNGSWVKVATAVMDTVVDPYQYQQGQFHTTTAQWFLDQTFQLPNGVSHVNITRENSTNGRTGGVNGVGPINWQAQGAGSGVRTATPNGALTRVRVIPS